MKRLNFDYRTLVSAWWMQISVRILMKVYWLSLSRQRTSDLSRFNIFFFDFPSIIAAINRILSYLILSCHLFFFLSYHFLILFLSFFRKLDKMATLLTSKLRETNVRKTMSMFYIFFPSAKIEQRELSSWTQVRYPPICRCFIQTNNVFHKKGQYEEKQQANHKTLDFPFFESKI